MKIKTILPLIALMTLGAMTQAASYIRVINESSVPVQAIWQAGGCARLTHDWTGDSQGTVCREEVIQPAKEGRWNFGMFEFDRSVKIFSREQGRVGYCNSMDNSTMIIHDAASGKAGEVAVENHCAD